MKEFAYLVQTRKHYNYFFDLQSDNSDCYVLNFNKPIRYRGGITSIYFPKSTWNTGRNRLLEAVKGKGYKYIIFLDDDILLKVKADGEFNPWRYFEAALNFYKPVSMVGNYDWHLPRGAKPNTDVTTLYQVDACLQAFRHDVIDSLLPYPTKYDTQSWCISQYIVCQLLNAKYPNGTIQLNSLEVKNMAHDNYPRQVYDWEQIDKEIAHLFTSEQLERFLPYYKSIRIEMGEFTSFQ